MIATSGRDAGASAMANKHRYPHLPGVETSLPRNIRAPEFPAEERFLALGVLDSSF